MVRSHEEGGFDRAIFILILFLERTATGDMLPVINRVNIDASLSIMRRDQYTLPIGTGRDQVAREVNFDAAFGIPLGKIVDFNPVLLAMNRLEAWSRHN